MRSPAKNWTLETVQQDRYLSETLAMAGDFIHQGNADEAVKYTGQALLYLLHGSLPLAKGKSGKLDRLLKLGIALKLSDADTHMVFLKSKFTLTDATAFLHLFFDLVDKEKNTTAWTQFIRSCREGAVSWLDRFRDSVYLNIHGKERIALCRIIAAMKQAITVKPEGYSEYFNDSCRELSRLLREPLKNTVQIVRRNAVELAVVEHRRNRRRRYQEISQYRKLFRWDRKQDYMAELHHNRRSRIIAVFHFGDFIHALNFLSDHSWGERHRLVLRHSDASINCRANTAVELGSRQLSWHTQVLSQQADPLTLVALLRRGNTSLSIFCDLPRQYGEVVEVNFLGRRAWFPKGPAQIALLSKAPLLPFLSYNDGSSNIIQINSLLEPVRQAGESFQQASQRLTQQLIHFFEKYLKRYPEQWRYLNKLPSYFVAPSDMSSRNFQSSKHFPT